MDAHGIKVKGKKNAETDVKVGLYSNFELLLGLNKQVP
jgi:hypothetical protein